MKIMRSILILSLCCFTNLLPAQYFQHRIDSNINTMRIDSVGKIISELRNYNPNGNNRYLSYWEAYALYKCSILSSIMKKKEDAKKFTEKAIEILESIKGKTTEDYALLGMLKNYQINFSGWLATIKLSNQAKSMAQKAIELNGNNLRAYLVLGINNYYTPEFYGGKSKCEEYFKKAISLPDSTSGNEFDPTWGREDAFYFLLAYYKGRKNVGDKELFENLKLEALDKFPNDKRFNRFNY